MNQRFPQLISSKCMLVVLMLISCGCAAPSSRPLFQSTACKFGPSGALGYNVECGNLLVPENRAERRGKLVQLHVAIVRTHSQHPSADPVVYLEGGWAGPALAELAHIVPKFEQVLRDRDLIVFDQRGVGYSEPSLDCPEIPAQVYNDTVQRAGREARVQHYIDAARTCHDRLIAEGNDLKAYTTLANAADVNDLRIALGYSEWNVYGISYGTRIALAVMRHYPDGVRSVILDSSYPPQKNVFVEEAAAVDRSLDLLAERCAADASCFRKYPDVTSVFYDLIDELDANPRQYVDGNALIETVWGWMYRARSLPWVPQYLYQMKEGRWTNLPIQPASILQKNQPGTTSLSEGKRFSVICAEEVAHTSPAEIAAANADVPPRLVAYFNEPIFEICSFWGATPAGPEEYEAVVSDVRTLVLQGDYDPATPPAWGRATTDTLSAAYYFEFPAVGHGVLGAGIDGGACSKTIANAFLSNPTAAPDSSCLNAMKPFFVTVSP